MDRKSTGNLDDLSYLSRLDEVQKQALDDTETQKQQWKKFESDYVALQNRLKTLPDKMTHDIMVPFGSIAFMPGKLVHTNEVLVLLGENWFVDRSAKQSCEIIDRRLKEVQKKLSELDQQKNLILGRSEFTEQLKSLSEEKDKCFEIKEEYNEETERKWKERHRENVKIYRHQEILELSQSPEKSPVLRKSPEETEEDTEIWTMLDRLEKQEQENNEIDRLSDSIENEEEENETDDDDEYSDDQSDPDSDDNKSVSWKDFQDEKSKKVRRPNTIHFSHSPVSSHVPESDQLKQNTSSSKDDTEILVTSPGDIYQCFVKSRQPKSILKVSSVISNNKSSTVGFTHEGYNSDNSQSNSESADKNVSTASAFTGQIVERESVPTTSAKDENSQKPLSKFQKQKLKTFNDKESDNTSNKPLSKFKALRQNNR